MVGYEHIKVPEGMLRGETIFCKPLVNRSIIVEVRVMRNEKGEVVGLSCPKKYHDGICDLRRRKLADSQKAYQQCRIDSPEVT